MTDHPPPELVQKWSNAWLTEVRETDIDRLTYVAEQASYWGADERQEAIIHWLITGPYGASIAAAHGDLIHQLRNAMQPKPPSLKQQAISDLHNIAAELRTQDLECNFDTILLALEALSDE